MSILKSPIVKISLRHLLAKKRQIIVAMMGVMFGIAIFIFQAGLMSGFQTTFIDQTVNTTANIRLYNEASKNRPSILSQLDSMKGRQFGKITKNLKMNSLRSVMGNK
jgi:lipoprotein-releasing system permease protein